MIAPIKLLIYSIITSPILAEVLTQSFVIRLEEMDQLIQDQKRVIQAQEKVNEDQKKVIESLKSGRYKD